MATRNPRDAAKVGAAWSFFLIIRWEMTAGITLLALSGVVSVTDPEKIMPIVLRTYLPMGLRGIVTAGLLAAFMSTFSATVNSAASFVVRDLFQPFFLKAISEKKLVTYSRIATVGVVVVGIAIGSCAQSIAQIWNWIMMALGAGVIMPNVLRWYWWRMTGWGYAAGTLGGIALSLMVLLVPDTPIYVYFPPICLASLVASILGSYLSKPIDNTTLIQFYEQVRPFGLWGPVKAESSLSHDELGRKSERLSLTVLNTVVGIIAITGYYLFPMYLVGHWHFYALICLGTALAATGCLALTWYRNLPVEKDLQDLLSEGQI